MWSQNAGDCQAINSLQRKADRIFGRYKVYQNQSIYTLQKSVGRAADVSR